MYKVSFTYFLFCVVSNVGVLRIKVIMCFDFMVTMHAIAILINRFAT